MGILWWSDTWRNQNLYCSRLIKLLCFWYRCHSVWRVAADFQAKLDASAKTTQLSLLVGFRAHEDIKRETVRYIKRSMLSRLVSCSLAFCSQASWTAALCFRVPFLCFYQVVALGIFAVDGLGLVCWAHFQVLCMASLELLLHWRVAQVQVLDLREIKLLRPQHRSRSCNPDPADECFSTNLIMLHSIYSDKCACASEACLAVDSNCSWVWFGEVSLTRVDKLVDDGLRRRWSIHKDHVFMVDTFVDETHLVVFGLIKANNFSDF